jgi:hypothetical protein
MTRRGDTRPSAGLDSAIALPCEEIDLESFRRRISYLAAPAGMPPSRVQAVAEILEKPEQSVARSQFSSATFVPVPASFLPLERI